MKVKITQGYDVHLIPENSREERQLERIYDKHAGKGVTTDLIGVPGRIDEIILRPADAPSQEDI